MEFTDLVITFSLLSGSLLPLQAASGSQAFEPPLLTVVIRAEHPVSAESRGRMEEEMIRIFQEADIALRLIDCDRDELDCSPPLGPTVLDLRLTERTQQTNDDALGVALIRGHQGVIAKVFSGEVEEMADQTRWNAGDLLARVAAHEIGHLLGLTHFPPVGIMQSYWTPESLLQLPQACFQFLPHQAAAMRKNLATRLSRETLLRPAPPSGGRSE